MSKTVEICLPWPDSALSPNSHLHWRARQAARILARDDAMMAALATGKKLDLNVALCLTVTMYPPDRRRRDADNVLASLKVSIDSLCGAIDVDDWQIRRVVLEWGDVMKGGQVMLKLKTLE